MDDLERLQSMFPSVDGDVVAIVFNEYDNDVDVAIEMLKKLAPQVHPAHRKTDTAWPSLTPNTSSASLQNQSAPGQDREYSGQNWSQVNSGKGSRQKSIEKQRVSDSQGRNIQGPNFQSGGAPSSLQNIQGPVAFTSSPMTGTIQGPNIQGGFAPSPNVQGGFAPYPMAATTQGPNVQGGFGPPSLVGNIGGVFSPPGLDNGSVRPHLPPPNISHPPTMEGPGMGMWNPPPFRTNYPNVPGYRMGVNARPPSGSNPYQKWTGYDYPRPRPLPPVTDPHFMPRPSVHHGYNMPPAPGIATHHMGTMMESEHIRRAWSNDTDSRRPMGEERQFGYPGFSAVMSHPHATSSGSHAEMSHSRSALNPALQAPGMTHSAGGHSHSHSAGVRPHSHDAEEEEEAKSVEDERKLILLRGLPGSGKSTMAKTLVGKSGVICSTDDFFMVQGKYEFNKSKLSEYHELNRMKAKTAMKAGKSPVIIDNTNSASWEMRPYVLMAKEFGYSVVIKEPNTSWRYKTVELARRNKHGITRLMLDKLLDRFEHRVSVASILKSEEPDFRVRTNSPPPKNAHSTRAKSPAPQTSGNQIAKSSAPLTSKAKSPTVGRAKSAGTTLAPQPSPRSLPVPQPSKSNPAAPSKSHPQAPKRTDKGKMSPQPAQKREKFAPKQSSKSRRDSTESKIGISINTETIKVGGVPSEGVAADGRGKENKDSNSAAKELASVGSGVGRLREDVEISFKEHHEAIATVGGNESKGSTGGDTEAELAGCSARGENVEMTTDYGNMKEFESTVKSLVGVSSEENTADEKYSVNYSTGKSYPLVANVESFSGGRVLGTKNSAAVDTGAGGKDIRAIGQEVSGRGSDEGARRGAEEREERVKGSESDFNDQWDSSEEVDLNGEDNSESEGESSEGKEDVFGDEESKELEAEIAEEGSKGQSRDSVGSANLSEKNTPLSPDQWQSEAKGIDMWKADAGPLSDGGRKSKHGGALEEVLAKTQHPRYALEGDRDEKNFSLAHQQLLVGQLVSEYRSVCALAEDEVNPRNEDVLTLSCLLERSKFNSFHSYLPDIVVEQVLKDRSMAPSLLSVVKPFGGGMKPGLGYWNQTVMTRSQLLKIAVASAKNRSAEVAGDPAIVHEVSITPADSAEIKSSSTAPSDLSADDPSIVSIPSKQQLEPSGGNATVNSVEETTKTRGYDSEDPLPIDSTPLVFPSALPSEQGKNLEELFSAFSSSVPAPARHSTAQESASLAPVPCEGGAVNPGIEGEKLQVLGSKVVSPAKMVASSETIAGDKETSSDAKSAQVPTRLSVQELEQLMASSEEAYLSANSGGGSAHQFGSNPSETVHSATRLSSVNLEKQQKTDDIESPLPTLEKWAWHKGPSSMEMWSPGSGGSELESSRGSLDLSSALSGRMDSMEESFDENHVAGMDVLVGEHSVGDTNVVGDLIEGSLGEQPTGGADLAFLAECFPDLDVVYLEELLMRSSGSVEEAVSMALLSTVTAATPLSPFSGHTYFGHSYETQSSGEDFQAEGRVAENGIGSMQDTMSHVSNSGYLDGMDKDVLQLENGGLHLKGRNDEEIARILQEKLNREPSDSENGLEETAGTGLEDDNLVLKLTPSLARQLQSLFGPIQQHLPAEGLSRDSDFEVLLSERAAGEIYQKWVDTLEAKRIDHHVHSQLLLEPHPSDKGKGAAAPEGNEVGKRAKKKKKKAHVEPLLLEFKSEKTLPPSVWTPGLPPAPAKDHSPGPLRGLVQQLHQKFPSMPATTVNQVLVDNKFDEKDTIQQLTLIQEGKIPPPKLLTADKPLPPLFQAPPTAGSKYPKPKPCGLSTKKLKDKEEFKDRSFQTFGDPSYNDLRAESALHAKLRAENFQKAAHARSKKQYEVARYYAEQK